MPGGRPSKLTPELQARICEAIRAGNYIETAAAYAGVHKATLYDWLKRGANANAGKFREFSDAVEKALADAEARDVALIAKAATEHWQAAAWRLERKFPDKWGRRQRLDVVDAPPPPESLDAALGKLTREQLDQLESIAGAIAGAAGEDTEDEG